MRTLTLPVGELGANCHIASRETTSSSEIVSCVVIDPGAEAEKIDAEVRKAGLSVELLLLTHSHADHLGAVDRLLDLWPDASLACSAETSRRASDSRLNLSLYLGFPLACRPAGRFIGDGEKFAAAGLEWQAIGVPGHKPGELVYLAEDGKYAFTGDTVFAGSIGRSDFPGVDGPLLVAGIRRLFTSLPPDAVLFPGHVPATRAGDELASNPYL